MLLSQIRGDRGRTLFDYDRGKIGFADSNGGIDGRALWCGTGQSRIGFLVVS